MPAERAQSDAYVDRLGDRISSQHAMPEHRPEVGLPVTALPPARDASDVHSLPSEEDDALELPPAPAADAGDAFAEFEEDLEGEATRIEDGHLLAEQSTAIIEDIPVQPFLYVEKGNDEGREFVLQEGENGIGRGIDNDVILADVAVSRRHLIVIREGDVIRMRDLGSGNGTQVNGKRTASCVLAEGDRIEVGETVLCVRLPGGTPLPLDPDGVTDESNIAGTLPPPATFHTPSDPFAMPGGPGYQPELTPAAVAGAPAARGAIELPKPVFIAILLGAGLILAALGVTVVVLVVSAVFGDDEEAATVTLADEAGPFTRGVAAYEAREWDRAEAAFREAVAAPDGDPRAPEYLQRTLQAREHATRIAEARAALERGDGNTALAQASAVPADSPLASEAQALRTSAQAQQVEAHVSAAREALGEGDEEAARRSLALARNIDADSALVRALEAELDGEESEDSEESEESEEEVAEPDVAREAPARPPRRDRGRPSRGVSTADIIGAYIDGRFSEAARMARSAARGARGDDRRELERLATKIERFGALYQRIRAARFGTSVRGEMEQAIALDRTIARNGRYRDRLREKVVDSYLADAQRLRADPVRSCSAVRQALIVDRGNVRARQMSGQCEAQARGMVREASRAQPSRAQAIYRSVLLMVPRSSAVGRDASQRLDALRRSRPVDEDE